MSNWQLLGNHQVRVEGDVVFSRWNGPSTLAEVQAYLAVLESVIANQRFAFAVIGIQNAHPTPPEARAWIAEWSKRFALTGAVCFGSNWAVRTISTLMVHAMRLVTKPSGTLVFVATEAEALAWVDGERERLTNEAALSAFRT